MHPSNEVQGVRRERHAHLPTPIMADGALIRHEGESWSWSPTCFSNTKVSVTNVQTRTKAAVTNVRSRHECGARDVATDANSICQQSSRWMKRSPSRGPRLDRSSRHTSEDERPSSCSNTNHGGGRDHPTRGRNLVTVADVRLKHEGDHDQCSFEAQVRRSRRGYRCQFRSLAESQVDEAITRHRGEARPEPAMCVSKAKVVTNHGVRNAAADAKFKMDDHFEVLQAITSYEGGRDSAGVCDAHLKGAACGVPWRFATEPQQLRSCSNTIRRVEVEEV